MFCKGGPGKNHQARLPRGLVGHEGLSFILSCTKPWNTVYTHQGPTSPSGTFPWNVSIVLVFRLTSGPRNTSPCVASIRGRNQSPGWFCRNWPNIFSPNIRCSKVCYYSPFKIQKEKQAGLQVTSMDRMGLVLTPIRIR